MHLYLNYYKKIRNYIKNFSSLKYKFFFVLSNIRMTSLSLDELKQIEQIRNISGSENKSKDDLIKTLSEAKPKQIPKPETPTPKPEPEPKIRV